MDARYGEISGRDLSALPWYIAFGYFKLAVISEGIPSRYLQGKTVGAGFETVRRGACPACSTDAAARARNAVDRPRGSRHGLRAQRALARAAGPGRDASWTSTSTRPSTRSSSRRPQPGRRHAVPHSARCSDGLKAKARERGLWNLFLPDSERGAGLSVLDYAPLAELSGRSLAIAPEAMNCTAPDTGNMELLSMFATPEQSAQWLDRCSTARSGRASR